MSKGIQRRLAHLLEQVAEADLRVNLVAHYQRVDKQANGAF